MTKINPIDYHYHSILKDAVINPTKAYYFNSWNCLNPSECREYAVAILRKKFNYSDSRLKALLKKAGRVCYNCNTIFETNETEIFETDDNKILCSPCFIKSDNF